MLLIILGRSNPLIIKTVAVRKIVTFFTPLSSRSMRKSTLHAPHAYPHKKAERTDTGALRFFSSIYISFIRLNIEQR